MLRKNCLACGFIVVDETVIKTKEQKCASCSKNEIKIFYICPRCGNNLGQKELDISAS